ncbi:MAG TPA: ankyrin repeat domain-containing protein [Bryobacteraceae bacterium]|jgi:ankyrin repeat protein|nr:ankyrin repeat domain-containing protein [Bryobacteraceae bacterium]
MKLATILLTCLLSAACQPGPPLTPLIAAARLGDTDSIAALVKSGVDVNERGGVNNWTPLMHAVHKKQPASVQALIAAGADVNATAGARGRDTALRLAEIYGDTDIATILRDHGARASK